MAVDNIARGMAASAQGGGGGGGGGDSGKPKIGSISVGTTWSGAGPYTQTVTVSGASVTSKSIVNIQPTAANLSQMVADGVSALYVENNGGTLTLIAVGGQTQTAMTVQCTVEETA